MGCCQAKIEKSEEIISEKVITQSPIPHESDNVVIGFADNFELDNFERKESKDSFQNLFQIKTRETIKEEASETSSFANGYISDNEAIVSDYLYLAQRIFDVINDLRENPQKYLNRLSKFLKHYNKENRTLELMDDMGVKVAIQTYVDPEEVLNFLEKASSIPPMLWSEEIYINLFQNYQLSTSGCFKIETDFILKSPLYTIFTIMMLDLNYKNMIFASDIKEGAVICIKEIVKTIIYFNK